MWPNSAKKNSEAFIEANFRKQFRPAHLLNFHALWEMQFLDSHKISFPESGHSLIDRFELSGQGAFYLKRQLNRSIRTWRRPFGEPTFAQELRNIRLCEEKHIPTLEPVYYAERQMEVGPAAILVVRALDGYQSLQDIMVHWYGMERHLRESILHTAGKALGRLHAAGLGHSRLKADDIIVDLTQIPQWRLASPQFIAPAKNRDLLLDVQGFLDSVSVVGETELDFLLKAYVDICPQWPNLSALKQALYPSQQAS
ncbi:lipopolysaccharide kinase InaA family protein [Pseudoteredinibacter isoporae]|uniref:tRNA A-37 threonylcarbamoyl transferase component Bud32 n=1 Tax=Pseudoteredinibacter isoporae TaxID=570281 RepID=A0A7X0JS40_9GAMM|nr:tRNA A-37 threonylcarbamoyl transferase component Bud32 [Pseudoteredinibacter isoporae]NHO86180.1 hypothetical protein [Pseudoteredinibacter isoporae]NIB25369.1 hypothetical protein [Pseudoteredinibacter isoporae]